MAHEAKEDDPVIPRPFKLRIEAEAAAGKKAKTFIHGEHTGFINYGLHTMSQRQQEDDAFDCMGYWQGMIIGIQNVRECMVC